MNVKEAPTKVLEALPEERLREVLDFAAFLLSFPNSCLGTSGTKRRFESQRTGRNNVSPGLFPNRSLGSRIKK